jgi:CBS domain-containing protein
MLHQPIRSLKDTGKVVAIAPGETVAEAAASMLAHGVAAVVVVDGGVLVGIFTEHDIVSRVIAGGLDPRAVQVAEVMTREPLTVHPDSTLGHALVLMHDRAIRHLPVVEHGKPVGIVCARDALDPELEDFISEQRRRETFR